MRLHDFGFDRFPHPSVAATFGEGLTVLIEPNPPQSLADWIADCMFGPSPPAAGPTSETPVPPYRGWLGLIQDGRYVRATPEQPWVRSALRLDGPRAGIGADRSQAAVGIDRELWSLLVGGTLVDGATSWSRLATLLHDIFGWRDTPNAGQRVAAGHPLLGDDRQSLHAQIDSLESQKNRLHSDLAEERRSQQARRIETETELRRRRDELERTRRALQLAVQRRDELDRRIATLEKRIEVKPTEGPNGGDPQLAALQGLYSRLDELERQLRAWHSVQQQIQSRRLEIRQQAKAEKALSIDAPQHPYHRVRELVQAIDRALPPVMVGDASAASVLEPRAVANAATDPVPALRQGLEAICNELREQYRHVRYRTTAAELKQLRVCFQAIDNCWQNAAARRQQLLDSLAQVDSAGAQLITHPSEAFLRDAQQHGYWTARCRQGAAHPLPTPAAALSPSPDVVTPFWNELEASRRDRARLDREIEQEENRERVLEREHDALHSELQRIPAARDAIEAQLEQLAAGIHRIHCELESLHRRLAVSPPANRPRWDRFWTIASELLARMTAGRVARIELCADASHALRLVQADGHTSWVSACSDARRTQARLALTLALFRLFREQGCELPIWLHEPLRQLDGNEMASTVQVLLAEAQQSQLAIVVSDPNAARVFAAGMPVVCELPRWSAWTQGRFVPAAATPASETVSAATIPSRLLPAGRWQIESDRDDDIVYRIPIDRPGFQSTSAGFHPAASASGESGVAPVQLESRLSATHQFSSAELNALQQAGIESIAELLRWEPEDLLRELCDLKVSVETIDRWQACVWFQVCIPGLSADDARVLVECGILDPEQLDAMTGDRLIRRLADHVGQAGVRERYRLDRINRWMRGLASTRPSWQRGNGYSRLAFRQPRQVRANPASDRWAQIRRMTLLEAAEHWSDWMEPDAPPVPDSQHAPRAGRRQADAARPAEHSAAGPLLRVQDPVEQAPSIGQKSAALLGEIGVSTVSDLLNRNPEEVAKLLKQRRISAETVRQWQAQARLAVAIPQLRGHDAQLLVACEVTDPQRLAAEDPDELCDRLEALSATKEGSRILRGSPAPDRAAVRRWVQSAQQHRALHAA